MHWNISFYKLNDILDVIFWFLTLSNHEIIEKVYFNNFYMSIFYTINILNFIILICLYRRIKALNFGNFFFEIEKIKKGLDSNIMTYCQYDLQEFYNICKLDIAMFLITMFLHVKYSRALPIVICSIYFYKKLFLNQLFRCYFYGKNVKRPHELNMLFEEKEE